MNITGCFGSCIPTKTFLFRWNPITELGSISVWATLRVPSLMSQNQSSYFSCRSILKSTSLRTIRRWFSNQPMKAPTAAMSAMALSPIQSHMGLSVAGAS